MDLEKLRQEINNIDDEMIALFKKRMQVVKLVAEYKIKNNMQVLDAARESFIINKYTSDIEDQDLKNEVAQFLQCMLIVSRDAQSEIIERAGHKDK